MSNFHSDQSANEVHLALQSALKRMAEAEKSAVICFGEIMDRKLYRELGFSSINQYAEIKLGFSARRTGDFIMLCRRLKKLPLMRKKIETGELGYTAARVIAPVVDQTNEKGWVDFAATHSRRELEREVKQARKELVAAAKGQQPLLRVPTNRPPAVVPVRVSMEMTPTQYAKYEALWEKLRKQGTVPANKVDAILEIMQSFATGIGPRGQKTPPVQIHIHECEECAKASIQTGKGELEIGVRELEQAKCDCQISHSGGRNSTSIPPKTRREILAKYRHKCQRPGCGHTAFLEIHHNIPRSRGGSNDHSNLTCLCHACHTLLHSGFGVKSAVPIYEWASGYILRGRRPVAGFTFAT